MASTKLTRTHGTVTNTKKYTWSAWVKRSIDGTQETLVTTRTDDNNYSRIRFDGNAPLQFEDRFSSNTVTNLISTELFRDLSAWYHVVVRIDYTQASASDRARMYVNGSEVSYSTSTRQSFSFVLFANCPLLILRKGLLNKLKVRASSTVDFPVPFVPIIKFVAFC